MEDNLTAEIRKLCEEERAHFNVVPFHATTFTRVPAQTQSTCASEFRTITLHLVLVTADPLMGLTNVTWPPGVLEIIQQCVKVKYKDRPTMKVVLRELTAAQKASERASQSPNYDTPRVSRSQRQSKYNPQHSRHSRPAPSQDARPKF